MNFRNIKTIDELLKIALNMQVAIPDGHTTSSPNDFPRGATPVIKTKRENIKKDITEDPSLKPGLEDESPNELQVNELRPTPREGA